MGKKKVVLDTNIFISALGWDKEPRKILYRCLTGEFDLVTSTQQLQELQRVINYPKFNFSDEQKQRLMSLILETATVVEVLGIVNIIKEDVDDNIIIETAVVGNAQFIISGDQHLLKLKEFTTIKIVNPREFLEIF
ncbi:MAG: putative toxin-antitoxin system toxin component, PIN family [Nanoarchaeota archaeon]|nr:putative toxin-antitoxin system toxin component, PIN family [Nanoarchaeota archaeon]